MKFSKVFLVLVSLATSGYLASAQGFEAIESLVPSDVVKNTAEKPQSKVWKHDGRWWAVYVRADGTYVGRLDGSRWTDILKITSSTSVEADCKVAGDVTHIFLWRKVNNPSQLISVEYDRSTRMYTFWKSRPSPVYIELDSGSETGTIDIDGNNRMWLATDGASDIRVRWSDPPYADWNGPHIIASGITDDDICVLTAMPGSIGVLWSDQNARRFGFRVHLNGAPPTSWSADEVPAASSAQDIGKGMADDHLNVAISQDGTLYCAVKTSYDTPGSARLALLVRRPGGNWDPLYPVSENGTRSIAVLNERAGRIRIVYTTQEDGGDILYRESDISKIRFSEPFTLIEGLFNNATASKDNYDPEVVILASDASHLVGVKASDEIVLPVGISTENPEAGPFLAKLFPNPAGTSLHVEFPKEIAGEVTVTIADATGRTHEIPQSPTASHALEIDLKRFNLSPGLYMMILRSGERRQVVRFLKE